MHPDRVLIKTSTDNSHWHTNLPEPIHFYGNLVLSPGVKRLPCMASAFLEKCASITPMNLIERKKLASWKFYESNLVEASFFIIVTE